MVTGALLLAACGGGGGGVSSPGSAAPPTATPAPTPTPSPTPSPTPTPTARSAEYNASGAVVLSKAGYAYDRNVTGRGVTIAVIDTGVDVQGTEFAGRVSPDSRSFDTVVARCQTCAPEAVHFDLDDVIGHGTEVASVALAGRNDAGVHGVAPDATLLALKISAPDLNGVTPTSPIRESENANIANIAPAVRYAVDKGAFVVTLSLNGVAGGQAATDQRAAMDLVRTSDRLFVQSVSNFTGEDSFTGQIAENLVGADRANRDWFLFAIGVDQNGTPRTSNGNAGPLADRMLAAAGNDVQVVDKDDRLTTVTGNSYAAPAVAGAAALLKQYWPQLGGRAISRILLDTATDAGAPGVDPVFGAGILNVERAMQAQAPASSFAAAEAMIGRWSSLTLSAPFGGSAAAQALSGRLGTLTVLDLYGRDYALSGEPGIRARGSGLLAGAMLSPIVPLWAEPAAIDRRLGLASSSPVGPWRAATSRPATFSFSPARGQTVSVSANVAVDRASGLAGSPLRGIASTPVGISSDWSSAGWSAGFSSGSSRDGRSALGVVRLVTPVGVGLEFSDLRERGQALGFAAGGDLGLRGARTRLATLTVKRSVAGVNVSARATVGRTTVQGGSELLRFDGPMVSTAFALDASRPALGGLVTLGASSPLRVERARALLLVPLAYDLISGALATERRGFDLSPDARELDLELGWSAALSPTSSLRLGVARAFDAGHVAGAADAAGFVAIVIR